jgi:hypothetical protein
MATNKLTTRIINDATLADGKREQLLADGDGLFLLLRPNGKTWRFEYRFGGRKCRMDFGGFPLHTLNQARDWADDQRRLLDNGIDPKRERDTKVGTATSKTVGDLLDTYLGTLAGKPSHRQVSNVLKNHIPDTLRKLPLATVTKADLVAPIRKLRDADKLRTAGLLHSYLVRSFALAHYAADNPDAAAVFVPFNLPVNPIADLKPVAGAAGETHELLMTIEQLREYATALQKEPQSAARDVLMLSLYCGGQRLTQVTRAVLDGAGVMVIADTKGKGGSVRPRRHALPIIGPVTGISPPGLTDETAVANLCDAATSIIEKISDGAYTQRVIRRTLENLLIDAGGFSESDTATLLSHGRSGLQKRHYLRGDRLDLKTRMLECLHGMLADQAAGANVISLHAAS